LIYNSYKKYYWGFREVISRGTEAGREVTVHLLVSSRKLKSSALGCGSRTLAWKDLCNISSIKKSSLFACGRYFSFREISNTLAVELYQKALQPLLSSFIRSKVVTPVCL